MRIISFWFISTWTLQSLLTRTISCHHLSCTCYEWWRSFFLLWKIHFDNLISIVESCIISRIYIFFFSFKASFVGKLDFDMWWSFAIHFTLSPFGIIDCILFYHSLSLSLFLSLTHSLTLSIALNHLFEIVRWTFIGFLTKRFCRCQYYIIDNYSEYLEMYWSYGTMFGNWGYSRVLSMSKTLFPNIIMYSIYICRWTVLFKWSQQTATTEEVSHAAKAFLHNDFIDFLYSPLCQVISLRAISDVSFSPDSQHIRAILSIQLSIETPFSWINKTL